MKISKLFHWLYALLMLAPAFFIGGRVLYTTLNKNAYQSYTYSNSIVNYSKITTFSSLPANTTINFVLENSGNAGYTPLVAFTSTTLDLEVLYPNKVVNYLGAYSANTVNYVVAVTDNYTDRQLVRYDNSFSIVTTGERLTSGTDVNTSNFDLYIYGFKPITLDNAFEYSVNQLNEVPLFSWASNTFLNEPFTYITGLFGISADSPINTLLSYWLSVSIIWLVFDLVMYVPLLVHRWLDKGGIE